MSDVLKPSPFEALMRQLDAMLEEAAQLSADIAAAMRRQRERPFWPDRRTHREPHIPERRSN